MLDIYPLEGQPPGEAYNAFRIGPEDRFGVGMQVWEFRSSAETARYFGRLNDTYIGARDLTRGVGDRSFRADFAGIRQLVFMSRRHNDVVAISCDETFCADDEGIERLAELVHSRL